MTEILPFLKQIIDAPGTSGYETQVRGFIEAEWQSLVDELSVSRLGSLQGLRKGAGPEPRPSILLAAHMDAIGLIVTEVVNGFIRFTQIGGVDPRILPGQPVLVHGREPLPGEVGQPVNALIPEEIGRNPIPMEYLWIDVGLEPADVARLVRPGDVISFAQPPFELAGDALTGHTLDDRASVAAITYCLQLLKTRVHQWDVWAVATVQEETSFGGAYTSSFGLQPDLGVAIDVTHAKGPGTSEPWIATLGKGMTLDLGPNIHPWMYKTFKAVADELEIPYQGSVNSGHSGTDAYAIQVTAQGKPTMVISIPLRYMHTPVETVSLKDIKRVGRLLAEFICQLDGNTLDQITWEG